MRILVIGGGGLEHALVWKMSQDQEVQAIYCAPGNAGIAAIADCVSIEPTSIVEAAEFAEKVRIDLTVVGPELPLTLGVVDEFSKRGLRIFGPTGAAAELEGSKAFAKEFMERHGIPTAKHRIVASMEEAREHLQSIPYPTVLKVDGLAAGKGVIIADDQAAAEAFARQALEDRTFGNAGDRLVIEECLEGREASFFALSDGKRVVPLVTCQDYKRLGDGDEGPNTGGMGSCSPNPGVDPESFTRILNEVVLPTISGMDQEGRSYRGLLYAGLMLTADGPKVLEYNARFGDPETQVLMPRLKGDLVGALRASADGKLEESRLEWHGGACVTVVLASEGYPGKYETGKEIRGIEEAEALEGVTVFQAATRKDGDRILTCGGRVLAVSALGSDHAEAASRAYRGAGKISFEGKMLRSDIAGDAATGGL